MTGVTRRPDDVVQTYFALRFALGMLSLALPPALYVLGHVLQDIRLQPSISAYYHSDARDIFVGVLWATGLGLIAYRGFSRREDWALNIGGVLACCIAVFPMSPADALGCILGGDPASYLEMSARYDRTAAQMITAQLHFPAAVSFYLVLGFVMIFCAHHTLHLVPLRRRRWYLAAYPSFGAIFVGSMLVVFVWFKVLMKSESPCSDRWLFWVEVAGVVSFALFWFIKTLECRLHDTDRRVPRRHAPDALSRTVPRQVPSTARSGAAGAEPRNLTARWRDYQALWLLPSPASEEGAP